MEKLLQKYHYQLRSIQHFKMTKINFSFVKDVYVDGEKIAKKGLKTAIDHNYEFCLFDGRFNICPSKF